MLAPKACVELFHLMFLRQFNTQIDADLYAIKGGCNLRFFFNSVRYSEDLDIDICTIQKETLTNKVNKILSSPSLLKLLQGYGISQIATTAPTQTQTTQRWKIQLYIETAEMPYHTKIEFSRRNEKIFAELANVNMKICQAYQLAPLRFAHYNLSDALEQKILALAHRTLTQARDIFDIYHLLHIATPPKLKITNDILLKAQESLLSISFDDYKSQVVNFLESEQQPSFDNEAYWKEVSDVVFNYLNGLSL